MANPQSENGHTDIANELVEAFAKIRISGEATQILWTIFRKTYGWKKKEDMISNSQFVDATGLSKVAVCKGINKLVSMGVVTQKGNITKKGNKNMSTYCIQKDYAKWKALPKKDTVTKKVNSVTKKGNKLLPKKLPTKENSTKEIITKEKKICDKKIKFKAFWELYPCRNGKKLLKGDAEDYFLKKIKDKEISHVLQAVRNYASSKGCRDGYVRDAIRFLQKDYWRDWLEPENCVKTTPSSSAHQKFKNTFPTSRSEEDEECGKKALKLLKNLTEVKSEELKSKTKKPQKTFDFNQTVPKNSKEDLRKQAKLLRQGAKS